MKKALPLVLLLSTATALGTAASAKTVDKSTADTTQAAESGFILRRHEFAASGAFLPGHDVIQLAYFKVGSAATVGSDGAWWLSYTYNFTKVFALQLSLSYDGYKKRTDPLETGRPAVTSHAYYITPMLTARFNYLNRKIVRLYSSVGAGVLVSSDEWYTGSAYGWPIKHRCKFGFQIAPIGLSVGKKLYGYAELGLGTVYYLGCAGIGYRF